MCVMGILRKHVWFIVLSRIVCEIEFIRFYKNKKKQQIKYISNKKWVDRWLIAHCVYL